MKIKRAKKEAKKDADMLEIIKLLKLLKIEHSNLKDGTGLHELAINILEEQYRLEDEYGLEEQYILEDAKAYVKDLVNKDAIKREYESIIKENEIEESKDVDMLEIIHH